MSLFLRALIPTTLVYPFGPKELDQIQDIDPLLPLDKKWALDSPMGTCSILSLIITDSGQAKE